MYCVSSFPLKVKNIITTFQCVHIYIYIFFIIFVYYTFRNKWWNPNLKPKSWIITRESMSVLPTLSNTWGEVVRVKRGMREWQWLVRRMKEEHAHLNPALHAGLTGYGVKDIDATAQTSSVPTPHHHPFPHWQRLLGFHMIKLGGGFQSNYLLCFLLHNSFINKLFLVNPTTWISLCSNHSSEDNHNHNHTLLILFSDSLKN